MVKNQMGNRIIFVKMKMWSSIHWRS